MVTIVKPIPYLNTTAKNKTTLNSYKIHLETDEAEGDIIISKKYTYRQPFLSYFPSNWSTSISIIAASRYFLILLITFMATISLVSLSQHSRT